MAPELSGRTGYPSGRDGKRPLPRGSVTALREAAAARPGKARWYRGPADRPWQMAEGVFLF